MYPTGDTGTLWRSDSARVNVLQRWLSVTQVFVSDPLIASMKKADCALAGTRIVTSMTKTNGCIVGVRLRVQRLSEAEGV